MTGSSVCVRNAESIYIPLKHERKKEKVQTSLPRPHPVNNTCPVKQVKKYPMLCPDKPSQSILMTDSGSSAGEPSPDLQHCSSR